MIEPGLSATFRNAAVLDRDRARRTRRPRLGFLAAWTLLASLCGCSSSKSNATGGGLTADAGATDGGSTARVRPPGPAADVSQEISGDGGPFIGAAPGSGGGSGYVEEEYVASGTATAYDAQGTLTNDGLWTFSPSTTAAYRTRVIVRRPAKASDSSGITIVEWLNVSGGIDANPDYTSLEEEIIRQGHTWVGVSAQLIGVEGGPVLVSVPGVGASFVGKGLKAINPARYGSLSHPGDGYSFDIFTQVARAVLAGGPLTGGEKPRYVLAAGESQSAIALTTYYDGVQPLTLAFDGFFVHSRGRVALPLVGPGKAADLTGALATSINPIFRGDLEAPVVELQSESDVAGILSSLTVRQPDTDRFRLWEVTGTSHADAHLLGSVASSIDCGVPINDGPMHLVAKAAFRGLETWVRGGGPPPIAPRLDITEDGAAPAVRRDADGIGLGGIRTPPVDVPVDVLSGLPGPSTSLICILLGSTTPLPAARLAALYSTRADYQQKYADDADRTIQDGFVLTADRDALIGFSRPNRISP